MNTLVISQCLYCLSCRFFAASSLSVCAVVTNPWLTAMVVTNIALQCLITYVPGVQAIWETEAMSGIDWLRVLLFSFAIFFLVEAEKAFGPAIVRPYVMPFIRRLNAALGCGAVRGVRAVVVGPDQIARTVSRSEQLARAHVFRSARSMHGVSGAAGAGMGVAPGNGDDAVAGLDEGGPEPLPPPPAGVAQPDDVGVTIEPRRRRSLGGAGLPAVAAAALPK
jgi:hypothetical protein